MSGNRSLHSVTDDSEDRTFDILRRPSINEMRTKYREFYHSKHDWTIGDRSKFFKSYHWTTKEFFDKLRELKIDCPNV